MNATLCLSSDSISDAGAGALLKTQYLSTRTVAAALVHLAAPEPLHAERHRQSNACCGKAAQVHVQHLNSGTAAPHNIVHVGYEACKVSHRFCPGILFPLQLALVHLHLTKALPSKSKGLPAFAPLQS